MTQLPVIRESDRPVTYNSVSRSQNHPDNMESQSHVGDEAVVGRSLSNTPDTLQSVQQIETSADAQMAIGAEHGRRCMMHESPLGPSCSRKATHDNEIEPAYSFELDEDAKFLRRSNLDRFDFYAPVPDIDEPECSQSETKTVETEADVDREFDSLKDFLHINLGYQLLGRIDEECAYMRYAKDISSDKEVIIIFYRFRVSAEHLAPYRKMEECNCVPKLLSIIRPDDGQSFLVFQCGEYTLCQWRVRHNRTEKCKKETLSQILSAIGDFHREEIVHGNLSLSTIMWFSDGAWKFLFPMFTHRDGTVQDLADTRSTSPYTASEIRNAIKRRESRIRMDLSCDMWSFGIIVSEILQDASSASSHGPGRASVGGVDDYRSSRRIHRKIKNVQGSKAQELVKNLTSSPNNRLTYKEAMEDAFFKPEHNHDLDLKVRQKWIAVLKNVMQLQRQHMEMTRKHHAEARASDTCADVSMEYFRRFSNPKAPFQSRKGRKVFSIRDPWLLQKSVPLLKVRQSYRLRVTLTNRQGSSVEALEIKRIEVSVEGGSAQSLDFKPTATDSRKHEVCALLELDKLESDKLKTVGPCFGDLDDKYVALNVSIKFTTDGDGPVQRISQEIWCRMVSPKCIMVLPRLLRVVSKGWRCLPIEVQGGALMLFIAAKFAVGL